MTKIKLVIVSLASLVYLPFANAAPIQWPVANGGNDHYYEAIVEPGITWFEAKAAAERRSGYLVTILSQAENDFLFANFVSQPQYWVLGLSPPFDGQAAGPWIGLYQTPSTDPTQGWQWLNNDGPLVYQNWLPFEPNNYQGAGEYAALFYDNNSSDSPTITDKWNDWSPNNKTTSYIVEYNQRPYTYIGGSVVGVAPKTVICTNMATGKSVTIRLRGKSSWDCTAAGLKAKRGQTVVQIISGKAQ